MKHIYSLTLARLFDTRRYDAVVAENAIAAIRRAFAVAAKETGRIRGWQVKALTYVGPAT